MPDPSEPLSSPDSPPVAVPDRSATRRRFLQGGLAAAPVLMTLVSRPVLAQQCTTPSGYVSLNASTAGRGVACMGHQPEFWRANTNVWPTPSTTSFNSLFAFDSTHYPGKSLLDVINLTGGAPDDVARNVVAALLNVQAGFVPVMTTTVVKDIWSEYLSRGSFSPSSGASWNHDEIIDYLRITSPS